MKGLLFSGLILSLLYSCGTTKLPEGQTEYEIPCTGKDYRTNSKFYRASGEASANASAGATKAARRKAEAKLISDIKSTLALVSGQYEEIIEDGDVGEYSALTQDFSQKVASGSLQNLRVICEKTTKVAATGMYKHYISIEMSSKDFVDDYIATINRSKKNSIRSNSEKMRVIFDEVTSN